MNQNLTHRIRERAYEIWSANGQAEGQAEQHWLAAEREILQSAIAAAPRAVGKKASAPRAVAKKSLRLAG